MTYQQTLDFMFAQLPMYHRIGAAAYKADLQPTLDLMQHLGHPERKLRCIHVAGTNGKGSVSHFLASILQEAGLKVGLYTSPHLVDFRERIRIGGEMIPREEVTAFIERHHDYITSHRLSFFEMTVGLAFDYFVRQQVDIAVVEVGMGGRLDSTNVVSPMLSIITNIGLDHTQFLGDTLEKIAHEKAGIIKPGVPVVIGETQPETRPVFAHKAAECHSPITFADQHHVVDDIGHYTTELTGDYQKKNIATVLEAVDVLRRTALPHLQPDAIRRGLARVVTNTHLGGRWQTIAHSPLTICETAHNAPGIESMLRSIETTPHQGLHLIYGCVNDKDYTHILQLLQRRLPAATRWHFTQPSVQRALAVEQLVEGARKIGLEGTASRCVADALAIARREAAEDDLVLVTGSIFLVADALALPPLP